VWSCGTAFLDEALAAPGSEPNGFAAAAPPYRDAAEQRDAPPVDLRDSGVVAAAEACLE